MTNGELIEAAMQFTLLVEDFLRDDTGRPTITESDVAMAMYALRANIDNFAPPAPASRFPILTDDQDPVPTSIGF